MKKTMINKVKKALENGYQKVHDSYCEGFSGWDACQAMAEANKAQNAWSRSLVKCGISVEKVDVIVGVETLQQTLEIANSNPGCVLVMQYTDEQLENEMEASSVGEGQEERVCVYIIPNDLAEKIASKGLPFDPPVKKKSKVVK